MFVIKHLTKTETSLSFMEVLFGKTVSIIISGLFNYILSRQHQYSQTVCSNQSGSTRQSVSDKENIFFFFSTSGPVNICPFISGEICVNKMVQPWNHLSVCLSLFVGYKPEARCLNWLTLWLSCIWEKVKRGNEDGDLLRVLLIWAQSSTGLFHLA